MKNELHSNEQHKFLNCHLLQRAFLCWWSQFTGKCFNEQKCTLKHNRKIQSMDNLCNCHCSVCLFIAALYKLIFVVHQDVLFDWSLKSDIRMSQIKVTFGTSATVPIINRMMVHYNVHGILTEGEGSVQSTSSLR